MKTCQLCHSEFPTSMVIEGEKRNLSRRKYCLRCSPFGKHNTLALHSDTPGSSKASGEAPQCVVCGGGLRGNQTLYCGRACKNKVGNTQFQTYAQQKERAFQRKSRLVMAMGGECSNCGYKKNLAALEFHHLDPTEKEHDLSTRKLSNASWEWILKEAKKCILLCANCHREKHNPEFALP